MTRDELLKNHETICQEARDLMELKNRDYAGNGGLEPFANFTRCEAMGVCTTEQGFLVRIVDKLSRMSSFIESGTMHVRIDLVKYFSETGKAVVTLGGLRLGGLRDRRMDFPCLEHLIVHDDKPFHGKIIHD